MSSNAKRTNTLANIAAISPPPLPQTTAHIETKQQQQQHKQQRRRRRRRRRTTATTSNAKATADRADEHNKGKNRGNDNNHADNKNNLDAIWNVWTSEVCKKQPHACHMQGCNAGCTCEHTATKLAMLDYCDRVVRSSIRLGLPNRDPIKRHTEKSRVGSAEQNCCSTFHSTPNSTGDSFITFVSLQLLSTEPPPVLSHRCPSRSRSAKNP